MWHRFVPEDLATKLHLPSPYWLTHWVRSLSSSGVQGPFVQHCSETPLPDIDQNLKYTTNLIFTVSVVYSFCMKLHTNSSLIYISYKIVISLFYSTIMLISLTLTKQTLFFITKSIFSTEEYLPSVNIYTAVSVLFLLNNKS